ncbi:cysteine-rich RLK (RECEPTOR-like protein kinase) 8 [Hibiscus trionum]|uniref:Cysteine-rich RLK (RECEPTOR-like protein kinase) 8 n=1 Tax=Hibiscus trionum TaxID=183268 RepID=A0A9W7LIN0_HIBTR|nr:cysteine-rich RLK (RECEPTOR-like protein kinase) 8 [Hibiscus trionum]
MEIPQGLGYHSDKQKVCKLEKSLYGLKQSPRAWFDGFAKAIVKNGEEIGNLKKLLASEFETKDLDTLRYFLGMKVARSEVGLVINQRKYILDLLFESRMKGCKPAETPMEFNLKLKKDVLGSLVNKGLYQRLVGKLIYLSLTRPDISFLVSIVSQYLSDPRGEHLEAVNRILKYLKMTPGHGLIFKKTNDRSVKVFIDASWAGELTDKRSTNDVEAEYRAIALGMWEGIWLEKLLVELGFSDSKKFELYSDSQSATSIVRNLVHHDMTKHVEIDRQFISEKVSSGLVELNFVYSKDQLADILTKALSRVTFDEFTCKLGLCNIYSPA